MSKKSVELEQPIKKYDPAINDAKPIKFNGIDIYCNEKSWYIEIYNSIFNRTDNFIENKNDKLYWNYIIENIKETENTGDIAKQYSNKTNIEKKKSIIKLFKRLIKDIDAE
tara:strand:- start:964 stop:1296 length:333 start_codon:yes stop_codon:yes gene_type:complete